MQYFKGDETELKFFRSANPALLALENGKDDFFDGAYSCFKLGEVLYDGGFSPLANAIPRDIFRESFSVVYDAFVEAGSFESYLTVFRNIFGPDVEVTFTVPAPGKLQIDIVAAGLATYDFTVRTIVDDAYVRDTIVDDVGDTLIFRSIKGFETQYELEQMLFEMVPGGIYTEITLTIGGS